VPGGIVTISGTAVSPGWYKDPAGSHSLRWWDGNQWTNHMQPQPTPPPPPTANVSTTPIGHVPFVSPSQPFGVAGGSAGVQSAPSTVQAGMQYDPAWATRTSYQPRARGGVAVSNRMAWIGFGAGIAAIVAIFFKFADPNAGVYLPVFGLTAIVTSIRAIIRYRNGSVTVLWAPVVGLVLGAVAELALLSIIAIGAVANAGAFNGPSGSKSALGPTAASTINYSMGQGGVQYPPTGNPNLSNAAAQEAVLVAKLRADYGPGQYPSALHLDSTGEVVASDGTVLGDILGQGWFIGYTLEGDGSYLLEISAQPTDEVAVYFSVSDEYWAWCGNMDATCKTSSPVPPSTSQTPTISGGSTGTND